MDGIFVQIGLTANSALFKELLETNRMGEILTDKNGRTSVKGIYAAGDVTDVSYKQIVIAMGGRRQGCFSCIRRPDARNDLLVISGWW